MMNDRYEPLTSGWQRTARPADPCPPAERLAALADGRAWPWQRRRLADHLSVCADCAGDYQVLCRARAGLLTTLESLDEAGTAHLPGRRVGWFAAAAAGLFAVILVPWLSMDRMDTAPGRIGSPGSDPERVFATAFESDRLASVHAGTANDELLFRGDFDNGGTPPERIHADHFSG